MRSRWSCLGVAAALVLALPAHAMNKCVDARGRVTFQEDPCPGAVKRGSAAPAEAPKPAATPSSQGVKPATAPAKPSAKPAATARSSGSFNPKGAPKQEPGERSEADKRADTDPHYRKQAEEKRRQCASLAKDIMNAQGRVHTLQGESRARMQASINSAQDDYQRRCPR